MQLSRVKVEPMESAGLMVWLPPVTYTCAYRTTAVSVDVGGLGYIVGGWCWRLAEGCIWILGRLDPCKPVALLQMSIGLADFQGDRAGDLVMIDQACRSACKLCRTAVSRM